MQEFGVYARGDRAMAFPTDILVTGGTVSEGAPAGTLVAVLGAVDADAGDSFTFALTSEELPYGLLERWKSGKTPVGNAAIPEADLEAARTPL